MTAPVDFMMTPPDLPFRGIAEAGVPSVPTASEGTPDEEE